MSATAALIVAAVLLPGGDGGRSEARRVTVPAPGPVTHSVAPSPAAPSQAPGPVAPPTLPEPPWSDGVVVRAALVGRSALTVEQWVTSTTGLTRLAVSMPRHPVAAGAPQAVDLVVEVDGVPVPAPSTVGSEPVTLPVRGARVVRLTYRIPGAVLRSTTRPDRGLVPVVALRTDGPDRTRTMLVLAGTEALSLGCTLEADGSSGPPQPCGQRDGQEDWLVGHRAAGGGGITALLDLATTR